MLPRNRYMACVLSILFFIPMMVHATLDVDSKMLIPATSRIPVIDGELDVVWKNVSSTYMRAFVEDRIDQSRWNRWRDHFAIFKVMYDEDNIYLYVEILDKDIHANDGVEFFFDGDNSKIAVSDRGGDDGDYHLRWLYNNTSEAFGNATHSTVAWKNTTYGYNFEAKIPKTDIELNTTEGEVFGFDVGAFDNDDGDTKTHVRWWSTDAQDSDPNNFNPSLLGTAFFVNRTVTDSLDFDRLTSAPAIDGELDDVWYSIPVVNHHHFVDETRPTMLELLEDWDDFQISYRAGWDDNGLYFYVNVIDDVISTANAKSYLNDSIELFFDGLNEKSGSYDSNDIHFRWVYGTTVEVGDDAPNSTVAFVETDSGYVFEAHIDNADIPFTPVENHDFGFEVRANDNDDLERDAVLQWFTNSTKADTDPQYFGTAIFSGQSLDHFSVEPDTFEVTYGSSTGSINLTYYGTGTVGWRSGVIKGESWLRIISESSGSRSGTVVFEYDKNVSSSTRTGQIEVRCQGANGFLPKTVEVIQTGIPVVAYNKILAVHGGNSIDVGDQKIIDHMEDAGLDVTLVKDVDVTVSDADDVSAVYIFESVTSNYVSSMFRDVDVPVIVSDPYIFNDMQMSTSEKQTGNTASEIAIVAPDDRLAFGFSDTISVYTITTGLLNLATPAPEAKIVATDPESGDAVLYYYNKGDHLSNGSMAAEKRIGFLPVGRYGNSLTESSIRLLEAVLDWVLPYFDLPKVQIVDPWVNDFTNGDKVLNPGEFVQLSFSIKNNRQEALSRVVGIPDKDYDAYLHPDTAYFFDSTLELNSLIASGATSTMDPLDTYVSTIIPEGHELTVPIKFYDQNNLPVGLDTLKFEVQGTDTRVPFFTSDTLLITYPPTYLPIDSVATMMTFVHEAGTITSSIASITNEDDVEVGQIQIYDDGTHGDTLALDRVFTGQWTADTEGELNATFIVEDQHGNVGADTNAVSFTVIPRRASEFNLVAPTGLPDTLIINNATIESDALEAGDQIGVFDDTLCVGTVHFDGTFPISVQIWYENGEALGAIANHLMLFKIYDTSDDVFYRGFPIFDEGNGVFGEASTVVQRLNSNLSSAFKLVDPTGRFQKMYVDSASIGMTTMNVGDQIGVFDDTLCVGAAIFEGTYPVPIDLWLESGSAIGAVEGEPLLYKIWDVSASTALDGHPMYVVGDGLFGEDSIRVAQLYAGFASAVEPVLPTGKYETLTVNLATLISEPIATGDQIGVFNDTLCVGSMFFDGTYPVVIPVWDKTTIRGTTHLGAVAGQAIHYKLWDNSSQTTYDAFPSYSLGNGIFGEDTTVVKRLNSNLNEDLAQIHPTGMYHTVYVDMAFYKRDTLQTGDQVGVFDDTLCVGASIYEGSSPVPVTIWLNNGTIGFGARKSYPMLYKVWEKSEDRLTEGFPVYSAGVGIFGEDTTYANRLQCDLVDSLDQIDPTGSFQTVYIQKTYYKNQALNVGDEIGVFYDTTCVGAAIYENVDPLAVTIWLNNNLFPGGPKNHPFHFKVWDANRSKLMPAFPVYAEGDGLFGEDSTFVSRLQAELADPLLQVFPTGSFETITVEEATIARNALVIGDQVGVFDDTVCVGAAIYEGTYPLPVRIWYENTIDTKNYAGATLGNEMSYKVWDSQFSQELDASALYTYGQGIFGEDTTAISRLITDAIALKLNIKPDKINMVSFNLLADSLEIEALFRPLTTLGMVRNDAGENYFPKQNINTLENVEFKKGYQVFADLDTIQTLSYIGSALDPTAYTLSLTKNESQWVGYPYRNSYKVDDIYGSIRSKVSVMSNDEGEFWIPSYGLNTITNLVPGKGYEVFVKEDLNFTFQELSDTAVPAQKDSIPDAQQFDFQKTGVPYAIVITDIGSDVKPGDEVAVYDGNLCVGASIVPEQVPFILTAWEVSDMFELSGFRVGNEIGLRVWQSSDSTVWPVEASFDSDDSKVFKGTAISVVRLMKILTGVENSILPTVFALEQNYPNPFNPETTIRYQLPKKADVRLIIYNMLGQEVKRLIDQDKPAGFYTIKWDGTNNRGMAVESGMYFVRIKAGDYVKTRKMIMVK